MEAEAAKPTCPNCGEPIVGKYCPSCGQLTRVGIPTLVELTHDTLGALFSYDHKLWRTVFAMVRHPGQLTVDYFEGKRARYLNPFQIFFWLEAIAFLAHRKIFSSDLAEADNKAKFLLIVGACFALVLSVMYVRRSQSFVFHLVAAVHLWAFLMLVLLVEYAVVPLVIQGLIKVGALHGSIPEGLFITLSSEALIASYLVVALRRIYRVSWALSILQTAVMFGVFNWAAAALKTI